MLRIGLTGGIAAGKSVVARRFEELGAVLVDADVLARQAVAPDSDGLQEVVGAFGRGILAEDGSLDRPALGRLIFGDADARERLNAIIHPRVRRASVELIGAAADTAIVVEDIPLLVETGQAARFHLVIVVDAPDAVRIRRMVEHRGMDVCDAEQRIAAQVPGPERLRDADAVLGNAGTPDELLVATDALWHRRLLPFAANLTAGRPSSSSGSSPESDPAMALRGTLDLARRVRAKLEAALPVGWSATFESSRPEVDDVARVALRVGLQQVGHDVDHDVRGGNAVAAALQAAGFPRASREEHELRRGADPALSVSLELVGAADDR